MSTFVSKDRRNKGRIKFDVPIGANLVAIDGTWCRECRLLDISSTGARIEIPGTATGLTEFFLVLTQIGLPVFRRCELQWVNGSSMGIIFVTTKVVTECVDNLEQGSKPA